MNGYLMGFVAGVCIVSALTVLGISIRILTYISEMYIISKTTLSHINRIDQVTQNTLMAADNFVDALRSAEQMPPFFGQTDDMRQSFEDTIKNFEEEDDDEERWKKK